MLREREPDEARGAQLLGLGAEAVGAEPEARRGGLRGCLLRKREGFDGSPAVEAVEDALGFKKSLGGEVVLLWRRRVGGKRERERERDRER